MKVCERMPPKKKSVVWNYFNCLTNKKVECKECRKTFVNFGNTTNLLKHLKKMHPLLYTTQNENENLDESSDVESLDSLASSSTSQSNDTDQVPSKSRKRQLQMTFLSKNAIQVNSKNIDRELVNMICVDLQPISIVENEGFQKYTQELNPNYCLPSRKILSEKLLPQQYDLSKRALIDKVQQVDYIACTTDMWTSDSSKCYLTLTAHYIYQGRPESRVIATKEMEKSHTSENIAALLRHILDAEWNFFNKVVCITTDNASNMKKAVVEILQKRHHPCVAHTLNLAIGDCLKDNERLLLLTEKCRDIVTFFKRSNLASYKLLSIQEQMNQDKLKLLQDVKTRWNSTYIMLDRLEKVKVPLTAALSSLNSSPDNLTNEEWTVLHECVTVLKPIEQLTTIFSGQDYPTLSSIIPLIRGVQASLRNFELSTDTAKLLKDKLMDTIDRRLGCYETNKTAAKATFLDPRFKKAGFGIEQNADNAQKWIVEELICHESPAIPSSSLEQPSCSNNDASHQVPVNNDSLWGFLDSKVQQQVSMATPNSSAIVKVNQYVQLPYLERNMDPCKFWEARKIIYKGLHKMSQKYLCIPATSVPSERVFSTAGLLCNQRRNRLEAEKVDQILFLNSHNKNNK